MASGELEIDPDIRAAWTLPAVFYTSPASYAAQLERVFAPSWQLVPGGERVGEPGRYLPVSWLPGSLDEPVLLTCDERGTAHALSNVCTHRANLVAECAGHARQLRCRYHGRRFALDGRFLSMPEFDGARDFPAPTDDLPTLSLERWGPLCFVALAPTQDFAAWVAPVRRRVEWLPLERFEFDPATSRDYLIQAHWALYCDNYLEGFHIPYVHEGLAETLDYGAYRTELWDRGSVQIGIARGEEATFELPAGHPDHGQRVAAYYFWLFPNLMLNFYPWGLSANVVEPQGIDRTRVRFLSYVWRPELRDRGAGADLGRVELEDETVVESVQRGVRSRLYRRGRFSPTRETGVHQFHRLLAQALGGALPGPR